MCNPYKACKLDFQQYQYNCLFNWAKFQRWLELDLPVCCRTGNGMVSAWISCTQSWKWPIFAAKCTKKALVQKPNYAIDYENFRDGARVNESSKISSSEYDFYRD